MGKKKSGSTNVTNVVNTKGPVVQDSKQGIEGDPDPLPLAQYVSLIGTHTLLLLFCMILMPRSTSLFMELPPQASSQDRPQAEWMAPVTVLPSWSVGWMCVGAAAVQTFWARRLRTWVMSDEGNAEANLDEVRRGMKVYLFSIELSFDTEMLQKDVWRAWGITLLGAGVYHLIIVILGAPLMTWVMF